jgi:hypothetical protein
MDHTISGPPVVVEPEDLEAAIHHYLSETDRSIAQMQRDRADIEKLKVETKTLLAETAAMIAGLRKSV